ncbi:protein PYRICULARIA ORYZAE RESISTANCE 21 [Momordica charantia]|uniref:Protein PYRICULARIA ORYZAE RESISTANCE 21 n=1 Tax=Momordica charantia TaxID=3673 RepID=A0A6J1CKV6_MOMCH|nr:protein PYRICULARIA ORYZAE RESISTANCE 21 [Momordica charantia]
MADNHKSKDAIMVLTVDLQCHRCYNKVRKVLSKFHQIRDRIYDEKLNAVIIKVVCCNPEKLRDNICCKGRGVIKSIEIKEPEKPKPPPQKQTDPPPERSKDSPPAAKPANPTKQKHPQPPAGKPAAALTPAPPQILTPVQSDPVLGYPLAYPFGTGCRRCYEGIGCGPCYQGYGRPGPCCDGCASGRPIYNSCGGGGPCYVSYSEHLNEKNAAGCSVM